VPDGGRFHLLSTSRLRPDLWLFRDEAESGPPRFGEPLVLPLEADWIHAGGDEDEVLHVSRFADVDGDGRLELLVGADYWGDYWPAGEEWFEEGYRPYDTSGAWRGGPMRGHVYVFENRGSLRHPELGRGLAYIHEKLGTRILEHQKLAAHVYALTEALIANGTLSLRDFERRKAVTEDQMIQETVTRWDGVQVLSDDRDKYEVEGVEIDCAARLHLCKAACCRMSFHLSRQDVDEGVVRWDVGRPYHVRHREDGWCTHCEPETKRCGVHQQRPLVCRSYDCRDDARVWEDFEAGIPNPALHDVR